MPLKAHSALLEPFAWMQLALKQNQYRIQSSQVSARIGNVRCTYNRILFLQPPCFRFPNQFHILSVISFIYDNNNLYLYILIFNCLHLYLSQYPYLSKFKKPRQDNRVSQKFAIRLFDNQIKIKMSELTGLQSILSKSHYKTQRKNKYSFSKSKRFPQLKQAYTIDFYDKPVLKDNRTCGFGYGSKYFFNDFSKSPSASQYSIPVEKTKGISFGVGRSVQVSLQRKQFQEIILTPRQKAQPKQAFRQYNPTISSTTKFKKSPQCSMAKKSSIDSFIKPCLNPQASKYNPIIQKDGRVTLSNFRSTRKAIFPKSERFIKNIENSLIGPGQYDTSDLITSKRQNPQRNVFALAAKKSIADEAILRSASPGPVYYVS